MRRILFVDDDPAVLAGLRRMLRPMRRAWSLHFACGAREALRTLDDAEFDVIVSDIRMPDIDGAELFEQVVARRKGVARIILSGQGDRETAVRTTGVAHRFLAKPCDAATLRRVIEQSCDFRDLMTNERLASLTASLGKLPSLPEVYTALRAEIESQDPTPRRVSEIVSRDMAMTAKILQVVNSAFFGLPRRISSLEHAVALLGLDMIKGLVLSNAAFQTLAKRARGSAFIEGLWRHSLQVGSLARDIARHERAAPDVIDDAMQAGILHDIGQLIFMIVDGERYERVAESRGADRRPLWQRERDEYDCDHAGLGAYLLGLWGLPESLIHAVAVHHGGAGSEPGEFGAAVAVHAADALSRALSRGMDCSQADLDWSLLDEAGCADRLDDWRRLAAETLEREDGNDE